MTLNTCGTLDVKMFKYAPNVSEIEPSPAGLLII